MVNPIIIVIIPALNEENAIPHVLKEIPKEIVQAVIVVDNGSKDKTYEAAEQNGAIAFKEHRPGYGNACLKGMAYLEQLETKPDVVVFLDGDYSDYPEELHKLVAPIVRENYDLVIGSRALGQSEKGALTPQQIFGNWLATSMIKWLYKVKFTDLGPFRAIRYDALLRLNMQDKNYGWTAEMQVKAAKQGLKCTEVPVGYRKRIGISKVSGTVKGTIMAGYKIIFTILRYV